MEKRILDMGCGRNKHPGAVGMDRVNLPEVDLVHNLNPIPYPIKDNIFDEVYATHVIEHMDSVLAVMEEIHRICRPQARVTLITPHYTDSSLLAGSNLPVASQFLFIQLFRTFLPHRPLYSGSFQDHQEGIGDGLYLENSGYAVSHQSG